MGCQRYISSPFIAGHVPRVSYRLSRYHTYLYFFIFLRFFFSEVVKRTSALILSPHSLLTSNLIQINFQRNEIASGNIIKFILIICMFVVRDASSFLHSLLFHPLRAGSRLSPSLPAFLASPEPLHQLLHVLGRHVCSSVRVGVRELAIHWREQEGSGV